MHNCKMDIGERIGVISDTHGLMREEVLLQLSGVKLIIHAGDLGHTEILDQLTEIAPVIAVRGNVDLGDWAADLPMEEWVEVGNKRIFVYHIVQDLPINPVDKEVDIVISGHSHKPGMVEKEGTLYLNPGSVGPQRFTLPISFVLLTLTETGLQPEFREIPF